jgi:cytochrome P450
VGVDDTGPAQLDPAALLGDWHGELQRGAARHWWAQGFGMDGAPAPVVLAWEATREVLNDRRLSPRSFVEDMLAGGISTETAAQVTPLFGRHGDDHRHLRAVLSVAFTPKKVEQLRPATRAITERLADGIEAAGGTCEVVAAFAEPLPPEVFALLFGLPIEDRAASGPGPQPSHPPSAVASVPARSPPWRRRRPRCASTAASASRPAGRRPATTS